MVSVPIPAKKVRFEDETPVPEPTFVPKKLPEQETPVPEVPDTPARCGPKSPGC